MFTLKIKTANAAFQDGDCNLHFETARILRELAERVESNHVDIYCLQDINGNSIGSAKFNSIAWYYGQQDQPGRDCVAGRGDKDERNS